ncbi:acid phosphatase [Aphelenchoides avenae]|nr:acid phosphatase [Aphelenchus avenae]
MYCSSDGTEELFECRNNENIIRVGMPFTHKYGLEDLFYKNGVDLEIWAHEHNYERMYPIYNRVVYNGTDSPYTDPPAPVHLTSGSGGSQEGHDSFVKDPSPWSVFRSTNYGFGRMQVFNATHLFYEQINAASGAVEDSFWLIKHRHGPYGEDDVKRLLKGGTVV